MAKPSAPTSPPITATNTAWSTSRATSSGKGRAARSRRGTPWTRARGVDSLVAHAHVSPAGRGIEIAWDGRPLEDFEGYPLDDLAKRYALMVIDRPHVGRARAGGCLRPLDGLGRDESLG